MIANEMEVPRKNNFVIVGLKGLVSAFTDVPREDASAHIDRLLCAAPRGS